MNVFLLGASFQRFPCTHSNRNRISSTESLLYIYILDIYFIYISYSYGVSILSRCLLFTTVVGIDSNGECAPGIIEIGIFNEFVFSFIVLHDSAKKESLEFHFVFIGLQKESFKESFNFLGIL